MTSMDSHRFHRQAVSPDEARSRILQHVRPLGAETVPLGEALGRSSAEAAAASHPFPPYRRSAMDGYAVRAMDLPDGAQHEPAVLEVLESLPAGEVPKRVVGTGQASRIMTGAMLPEGADTVVMLEVTETERINGREYVRIRKPVAEGRNVADIGGEFQPGDELFPTGRVIGAGEVALAAAFGHANLQVIRRPRVAILSTGSELLSVDEPLRPGKIRNSNAVMLAALLREAGAEPVLLGHAADDADRAERIIRGALAECDMTITTGGISVGDQDILVDILARWEGTTLFNKVAMRPGSPTTAAVLNGKLLLALSGNPGASFVGFHLFAVPAIRTMLCAEPQPVTIEARLAEPFTKVNAFPRFIRARTEFRDAEIWVRPTGADQSSLMKTIVDADCLLVLPPLKQGIGEGERVTAILLKQGVSR
ncbi:molybdopterin molybdotransferase MoeA [Cohnella pontilimi]|uniref:Molybdopterin molybdenumtransferase n=1 Tax=Cohnella pontilimi TaxID=2564100 RepID=A0A4U0FJ89_9BACL|nr:gephyrin-like molybdotransferase Glp [Cohnella pontilimi]TJY43532.1 molybdopterin molybdotransferase MoeA [Cohnella pontilimi]